MYLCKEFINYLNSKTTLLFAWLPFFVLLLFRGCVSPFDFMRIFFVSMAPLAVRYHLI